MGFRFSQPLGLPQAHPHHRQQRGLLPRCPKPLFAPSFWGQSILFRKANGILGGCLCFLTQTQCCFTTMELVHYSSLPVGEVQVPHIWVPVDSLCLLPTDLNPTQGTQQKPVALQARLGTRACQDFSSVSERDGGIRRAHQLFQGQLKEGSQRKRGSYTHFYSPYVASLILFLFTRSLWRPVEGLHQALPS